MTVAGSWLAGRTRLGFALRAIGEDETVARHTGVNTTLVKVLVFALTASVIALAGAILSLRYSYIDPNIAFNSAWSFQVLIMSLLGGAGRAWGPLLGVIPLVLLSEFLAGTFPAPLRHRARPLLRGHRLLSPRRRGPLARACPRAGGSGPGRADAA